MRLGCHIQISGGLRKAVERAVERGCETMQVFVSNPRGWKQSSILPADIDAFRDGCREAGIEPVFVHTIYLINLAAPEGEVREKSIDALVMNMEAAARLGSSAVVTHLGSHGGEGEEVGVRRVVEAVGEALRRGPGGIPLLLETTAGSGNSVGHLFEQLGEIIRAFPGEERLGVCLDTCHVFAAGYEVRTREGLEETLRELDREVGLERLRLVHANDSKGDLGSRVDRHEHIGEGRIGMEAFSIMARHPVLRELPWILETPEMTVERDRENLRRLREAARRRTRRG
ncbi:MAG: deoxyribonuclease IV [Actinobacteria bacterium]|nr:deoxyribonuclease IV [Actinomycetota bacterium]